MQRDRIVINVRGTVFETFIGTLERFPNTLLGSKSRRQLLRSPISNELTLQTNVTAFEAILFYYQSNGFLVRPPWLPMEHFEQECRYFQLSDKTIKQMKEREGYVVRSKADVNTKSFRGKFWNLLEYPSSSSAARVYAVVSSSVILASVVFNCVTSVPEVQESSADDKLEDPTFLAEFIFQIFFAVEFVLRLLFCPNKIKFVKNLLNIIDIIAIFPYFILLTIKVEGLSRFSFLRILRMVRVLRLLRMTKQSGNLETVIKIMKTCGPEMLTFAQCILVVCVFFGSLEYIAEYGTPNTQFVSIPESMWWALQTVVSLGYGDIVPNTTQGKFVGSTVAILGSMLLLVPLLSVGGKYLSMYCKTYSLQLVYDDERDKEMVRKKMENELRAKRQQKLRKPSLIVRRVVTL